METEPLSAAERRYLDGSTVVEIGRQFTEPLCPADLLPIAWSNSYGLPHTERTAPRTNGHPMRWVSRTVTYGPWEPMSVSHLSPSDAQPDPAEGTIRPEGS